MRKAHSIPTLLALVILIAVILGMSFGSSSVTRLFSRASNNASTYANLSVSNVTESGWTASWTTEAPVSGVVVYGSTENLGDGIASDDREIVSPNGKYKTHFVTVRVRNSGKYYFCVGNDTSSLDVKSCSKQTIIVPSSISGSQNLEPAYGKIVDSTGNGVGGVLVGLEIQGASKLSAVSKNDGSFIIPLTGLRTSNLAQYFSIDGEIAENLTLISSELTSTNITCLTGQDKPFPNLVLGKNGDCQDLSLNNNESNEDSSLEVTPTPTTAPITAASATGNKFKTVKTTTNNVVVVDSESKTQESLNIKDGQVLDNSLPTFSGKANPGDIIHVEVHSETPVSATIKASKDGTWSWTPPSNLAPGSHTVTLTITLASGATQKVTRAFTVSPGVDILPITSGTPSADIILITPTPIPTVIIETPTPTEEVPTVTPPITGSVNYSLWVVGGGVILLLGSFLVLL